MGDYKKSTDHLTNAALASPLALLAGGPAGLAMALGLGKLLDVVEDKDFEKRREQGKNDPHRYIPLTEDEYREREKQNNAARKIINEVFKDAERIKASTMDEDEVYIKIDGSNRVASTRDGIGEGKILFCRGISDIYGFKNNKAKLFYNAKDFLKSLNTDLVNNKSIRYYKIVDNYQLYGKLMYTSDNGDTYTVFL